MVTESVDGKHDPHGSDGIDVAKFEIIVGDPGGEIQNADIPVRWCVTPSLVREMDEAGLIDPHVLLISYKENFQEMQRQLVPLNELMTYLRFTRAGECEIFAWIVDGKGGRNKLHKNYTRKSSGEYSTDVFNYAGEVIEYLSGSYAFTRKTVEIPKGVFGKEPPESLKWYINWAHSSERVVDECAFRRRMILAVPKIPVFIIATVVFMMYRLFVSALLVALGFRRAIDVKKLFQPWTYTSLTPFVFDGDTIGSFSHSVYVKDYNIKRRKKSKKAPFISLWTFSPVGAIVSSILALVIFMAGPYSDIGPSGMIAYLALGTWFFLGLIVGVAELIVAGAIWLSLGNDDDYEWVRKSLRWADDFLDRHFNEDVWLDTIKKMTYGVGAVFIGLLVYAFYVDAGFMLYILGMLFGVGAFTVGYFKLLEKIMADNNPTDYMDLLCPQDDSNLVARYNMIPKKRRTLRLKYLDLKNAVCKPMQM